MTTIAKLDLNIVPHKEQKEVLYNLKNSECQNQFKINTSLTTDFKSKFKSKQHLSVKCEKWKAALDSHINRAFRKMRVRNSKLQSSEADNLINKRNKMRKNKQPKTEEINKINEQIAEILIKEGVSKANQFRKYCDQNSTIPLQQLWKLKKQTMA